MTREKVNAARIPPGRGPPCPYAAGVGLPGRRRPPREAGPSLTAGLDAKGDGVYDTLISPSPFESRRDVSVLSEFDVDVFVLDLGPTGITARKSAISYPSYLINVARSVTEPTATVNVL